MAAAEYSILTFLAVISVIVLDLCILKTNLLKQKRFWAFYALVIILQTIVDNYLNGRWLGNEPIVGPYPLQFYSGIKIWHTPVENYFYGFALVTLNIVLLEYFSKKFFKN
jgi:lycopene cyclase domain-containing protein